MENITPITNFAVDDIQKYLESCDQPFERSQLYSSARGSKFTDEDLRKSSFRTITDPNLFNLVDQLIHDLNSNNTTHHFILRRNDITHIVYKKGGFFKRHRDYLSTTSNLIEEFTLLLCVTPPDLSSPDQDLDQIKDKLQGGDTIIHTYGASKSFDTTTAGCGILFRKDLEHEGSELNWGEKHIITANIWATRETSKQVLLVTFPTEYCEDVNTKSSGLIMSTIQQAANDQLSYAIPVDCVTGMLKTHIAWKNRQAEENGQDQPLIIAYECLDFDYETFGVIDKIFSQSYVNEDKLVKAKYCLDYFGPFKYENILVRLALEEKTERGKKTSETGDIERPSLDDNNGQENFDADVIICETEARMKVVSSVARDLGEKYVPFRMLFVEGILETGGGMGLSAVEIPMTCSALLVGDYNNIFSLRKISRKHSIEPRTLKEIHSNCNFFEKLEEAGNLTRVLDVGPGNAIKDLFEYDEYIDGDHLVDFEEDGLGLCLKTGLGCNNTKVLSYAMRMIKGESFDGLDDDKAQLYLLPGNTCTGEGIDEEKDDTNSLFHRNESGMATFTYSEAERASDYIASLGLDERVKASLQKKRFILPQMTDLVDAHFCNESVYGKVNILWVCGVLRMSDCSNDGNIEKVNSLGDFDAWPSKEVKNEIEQTRQNISAGHRMNPDSDY